MENLNQYIDHTLLKPDALQADLKKLCDEAKAYQFFSVCVQPYWIPFCVDELAGSGVKVCTVVGFPLGVATTESKIADTLWALEAGASEIDMVINLAAVKNQNWTLVESDIHSLSILTKGHGALLKVILETCLLTDAEKVQCSDIARKANADFVKTSTGFSTGGATVLDVALMKTTVGNLCGVKASGGVRDRETAMDMIRAGATRLGTSSGVAIMRSVGGESSY